MKNDPMFSEESSVEEIISPENDLERKIAEVSKIYRRFNHKDFVEKAKKAFEIIFIAYAKGDKKTLKGLLLPRIYNAFSLAIDDRNSRKEILEGSLIRFVKSEIIDISVSGNDIFITMKFDTEQSNVLKSESGEILEGNSDFLENRADIWVFCKDITSTDSRWFLCEIKDLAT